MSYSLGIDVGSTTVSAALSTNNTTQMITESPDRAGCAYMSRLGDPSPVVIDGRAYAVTDLLGALLGDVVHRVTETQGGSPARIVLTHPASWGPFRCALFGEAARQAGLVKPTMVTEPEAAAAHYATTRPWNDGETIAVYDLGASTFNATVLRKESGDVHILGGPERIEHLELPGKRVELQLLRSNVDDMVRGPIKATVAALLHTLQSAQVEPADLSAVLLVGGSSAIPSVARTVSAELGCRVVLDSHPENAVALGAATLAAQTADRLGPAACSVVPRQRDPQPRIPEPRTPPPVAAPPPAPSPPPVEGPLPRGRHERPGGERPESTGLARQPRVLLGTGAAVVLTAMIALAVFGGRTGTQAPAPPGAALPLKPETTAVADVGPEVAVPGVGTTIAMERSPGFVAVSPDGKHAYTANRDAQVVTVLDTELNQVIATIPIATGPPQFLAFAPDGRRLYVTLFNDERTIHAIDVLDTGSNTVVATIPQPARPYLPAVTPDGKRLYVPNHDIGSVSVIDTATNAVISEIKVAPNPHGVTFSPDGRRAYTANHESNLVSVIDTATLSVLATIPVGTSPHSIAVNPHRPLAANVNYDAQSVTEINTTTQKVVATIPVGTNPQDIAWAPDGRFAYVVNQGSNTVSVIDAGTGRVTTTLPTGVGPTSIAVLPNGRRAYVSNVGSATLTVLELAG